MSELINNRSYSDEQAKALKADRQRVLKSIIVDLHNGKSVAQVQERFREAVGHVTVDEISEIEHALMEEEGIPVSEVQRLCSVHTAVFKGSIETIHSVAPTAPEEQPGHPVHTFKRENREIEQYANFRIKLHAERFAKQANEAGRSKLMADLEKLLEIDKHYSRKENLLFPYLERYGIFGPTKVMWGVDDAIRASVKHIRNRLLAFTEGDTAEAADICADLERTLEEVSAMIYKEENILLPMALGKLTEDEWVKIAEESAMIGYCLTEPEHRWIPARAAEPVGAEAALSASSQLHTASSTPAKDVQRDVSAAHADTVRDGSEGVGEDASSASAKEASAEGGGYVRFETGLMSVAQLEAVFNHLPVDLTFIDEQDVVRFFSHGPDRIFARTKAVIGRTVQNCHPPQSVHIVNKLLEDFKAGIKDVEDFWLPIKGMYVYIRYFAIRSAEGEYMGTLEFTQNIAPIQQIEGSKRIMST